MKNILITEQELNLINLLIKNELEIKLEVLENEGEEVDSILIKCKEEEVCLDGNWLIYNSEDELRFYKDEELLNYLKEK